MKKFMDIIKGDGRKDNQLVTLVRTSDPNGAAKVFAKMLQDHEPPKGTVERGSAQKK